MKFKSRFFIITVMLGAVSFGCNDFLDESPNSQVDASTYYTDKTSAETGITGVYNEFFDQNSYSVINMIVQVSTDDIKQNSGSYFKYKKRNQLVSADGSGVANPWNSMYRTIANANFLLQEVGKLPESVFGTTPERKSQILAEAHFIRGLAYYYLSVGWGDVPLITTFANDINEVLVAKSTRQEVINFVKAELELAEAGLPPVLTNYSNDAATNARKGRASKWAAKAYLARLALQENDWQKALTLSDEIITSGHYPFTAKWRTIFQHPMNASESILEQQNDASPGFFGSGGYGWFFGYDFEWSDNANSVFDKPASPNGQGIDIRYELPHTPSFQNATLFIPNKYIPQRGFAEGGIESMNFTLVRLSEQLLNKAEALNELSFDGNKTEVLGILNTLRARAEDATFVNEFIKAKPPGTTGIPPLDAAAFTTQDQLRTAIRQERRRELMFEDVIRWVDLYRWDKTYLKTITESPSDDHLFWPVPPDEIIRNPKLIQNPAYN